MARKDTPALKSQFKDTNFSIAQGAHISISLQPETTHVFDLPTEFARTSGSEVASEVLDVMRRQAEAMRMIEQLLTPEQLGEYRSGQGRGKNHLDDQFVVAVEPGHPDSGLLNDNNGRVHVTRRGDGFNSHYSAIGVGLGNYFDSRGQVTVHPGDNWDPWTIGEAVRQFLDVSAAFIHRSTQRFGYSYSVFPGSEEDHTSTTIVFSRHLIGDAI